MSKLCSNVQFSFFDMVTPWRGSEIYVWERPNWMADRDGRWVSWYGFDEMDWEII